MNFFSVKNIRTEKLVWDLVEFENGEISCYNYGCSKVFIYDCLEDFIRIELNDYEEIIKEGIYLKDEEK